ncbi:MAG: Fis family transcriptional regulator [Calditerrivibrio nitroreducens]|uniref:Fis family transcriptional regulator n=2 Tax=Calditerrivibrio TaxID=545865 RepID=A0A2J6WGT1_9BACT|nr:MAG: Fis family transcriptional regulator [Calditerrivibrio nitroreducens]
MSPALFIDFFLIITKSSFMENNKLSVEQLELILDNLFNGVYLADSEGKTLYVNKTFENMAEIPFEEIKGKNLHDLVYKYKYFTGSATLIVLQTKKEATATYRTITNKNFLVKGKPIFNEKGEIIYVVNTIWDLTNIIYNSTIDLDTVSNFKLDQQNLISSNKRMNEVINIAIKIAPTDCTILITGETGVGKSLIAEVIHKLSTRKNGPFIKINCGAIPENLIESELFGYESGAFTGASSKGKKGLIEIANGGTLFLDEISELPYNTQSKLLTFIQDKEFIKVGGQKHLKADVRIISASNKDLYTLSKEGKFREDLFYRLNVVSLHIPPLRERIEDIPLLTKYFLEKYNLKYKFNKIIAYDVIEYFTKFHWEGNIRELENVIERLILLSKANLITIDDLNNIEFNQTIKEIHKSGNLMSTLNSIEKQILLNEKKSGKTTREIAKSLGISQSKVVRLFKKHNISDARMNH